MANVGVKSVWFTLRRACGQRCGVKVLTLLEGGIIASLIGSNVKTRESLLVIIVWNTHDD